MFTNLAIVWGPTLYDYDDVVGGDDSEDAGDDNDSMNWWSFTGYEKGHDFWSLTIFENKWWWE